jgi:hypothetical protein
MQVSYFDFSKVQFVQLTRMFSNCVIKLALQGIHACWFDLRTQLLSIATRSGLPIMRHMFLHYWQDLSLSDMPSEALELMQTQVY